MPDAEGPDVLRGGSDNTGPTAVPPPVDFVCEAGVFGEVEQEGRVPVGALIVWTS